MKLLAGALLASILSASYAAAREASVYIFDASRNPSHSDLNPPSINPQTARLLLSHRLGVSQYHSLNDADEHTIRLLNNYGSKQQTLYTSNNDEDHSSDRKVLVVVEGVEHPEEIFDASPAFHISTPPPSSSNLQLMVDFLAQDRHRRGAVRYCTPSTLLATSIQGGYSKNDPAGTCLVQKPSNGPKGYNNLMDELEILRFPEGATSIFHVSFLEDILRQDGTGSERYSNAVKSLKQSLAPFLKSSANQERTVILMPPASRYAKRETNPYGSYEVPSKAHFARQQQSEDPLTMASAPENSMPSSQVSESIEPQTVKASARPKGIIPLCFSTLDSCNTGTNNCSGHGSCYRKYTDQDSQESAAVDCYACKCGVSTRTNSDGKNKTTIWGGTACQKKDISMPFFLIAGFTIALVATVSWGIGLLFSIGQEDLPSVIGAGVTGPRAQK